MVRLTNCRLWISGLLLFAAMNGYSQQNTGQAGTFLTYGPGGRAFGMGRAYAASVTDAYAIFTNPAGLMLCQQAEFTTLYSNLYYDTQFAQFAAVWPRPIKPGKSKLINFLFGPQSSIGIGWLGLNTTNFEQRSNTGVHLGNFDFGENAFYLAWARESLGKWGIFRYGLNAKLINQSFPGMESYDRMIVTGQEKDWSFGMDMGVYFQPIHMPVLNRISLKYLMPLHFGLVFRNFIQPGWDKVNGGTDAFPRSVRYGMRYTFIMKDWIPQSWDGLYTVFSKSSLILAYDHEWMNNSDSGRYLGIEGVFPVYKDFSIFLRTGTNNQTEDKNIGAGFILPFQGKTGIKLDYAYGFHPYLTGDSRIFLSFVFGNKLNAEHFYKKAHQKSATPKNKQDNFLRALAYYPDEYAQTSAEDLIVISDSTLTDRYHDFVGGLGRAKWNYRKIKTLLVQQKYQKARHIALEAIDEYTPYYQMTDSPLTDDDLMDYGECLLVASYPEDALIVLNEVENRDLRTWFLLGVTQKHRSKYNRSIEAFQEAVRQYENEQDRESMVCLSFLGIAESLIKKKHYNTAITALNSVIDNYEEPLNINYPRYWKFSDQYVVDDAQLLISYCYFKLNQPKMGVNALLETRRFYPDLDFGEWTFSNTESFLSLLDDPNQELIELFTKTLMQTYVGETQPLHQYRNN